MRTVVKVGTSTLTHKTGRLNLKRIETLARVISDVISSGDEVVLVTSGAIGAGCAKLGLDKRPVEARYKQAAAAVGQSVLMNVYARAFGDYGFNAAQLLLWRGVFSSEPERGLARDAFEAVFEYGAVPIVNENDSVSVEQLTFGDNDTLSAEVAVLVNADALVMFTDVDGFYMDGRRVPEIREITDAVRAAAGGAGSVSGTGGMATKLLAAEIAMKAGIPAAVAYGGEPESLYGLIRFEGTATWFR